MASVASNPFIVSVVRDTELGRKAVSFKDGWSTPLTIPTLGQKSVRNYPAGNTGTYPDSVTTLDASNNIVTKRAWHWSGKWCWDDMAKRMVAVVSPHIELDNLQATMLSVYDETSNTLKVYENPMVRSAGHCFDTNGIDTEGRRLFKLSATYWVASAPAYIAPWTNIPGSGYVQPQVSVLDLDQITDNQLTVIDGAARIQESTRFTRPTADGGSDLTAPGCDWFPGMGFVLYHNQDLWLWSPDTDTWTLLLRPVPVNKTGFGVVLHCIGHYNPTLDGFIFGGGSYSESNTRNYAFHVLNRDRTVRRLDDAPVVMSVNSDGDKDTKCCATYIPHTNKSVFFHNNRNIYILDPTAPSGSQWTVLEGEMDPDNPVNPNTGTINNDRWCCSIPEYNCIAVGHFGWDGTSVIRLWRH